MPSSCHKFSSTEANCGKPHTLINDIEFIILVANKVLRIGRFTKIYRDRLPRLEGEAWPWWHRGKGKAYSSIPFGCAEGIEYTNKKRKIAGIGLLPTHRIGVDVLGPGGQIGGINIEVAQ